MSNRERTDYQVTAHCTDGESRTIRSQNADAIRATAAYWSARTWVERVETNLPDQA